MCPIIEHTIEIHELPDCQTFMCITTKLQQNIIDRTREGDKIAKFLVDTMQGQHTDAKFNHRLEAAKHLIKYGFPDAECDTTSDRLSRAGGNPVGEEQGGDETPVQSPLSSGERVGACPELAEGVRGTEIAAPVTYLDILNYQIAHLIRHETAEGHTVVNFLIHIMTGRDRPFTPKKFCIKPADRMAAARELLRRGFGDLGSRRKQSDTTDEANAYDTLHTDLAKRMREYSERGTDTVRFLLEVMSDPDPDLEFTIHHRMSAAQELLRRGWDTNYDNIKPKHLQAYWRDKESPRLSIGQKKTQAGLSTTIDDYDNYDDVDYEAIAKEIREEEDRDDNSKPLRFQETVPSSRHSSESRNIEDREAATENAPLSQGEGWSEGSENTPPSANAPVSEDRNLYDYDSNDHDPTADYYFEPLNPDDQAIFDYQVLIESGGFSKGEVPKEPQTPPTSAYAEYSDTLRRIREDAARDGVPVLPNPLAGTLRQPTIRSP